MSVMSGVWQGIVLVLVGIASVIGGAYTVGYMVGETKNKVDYSKLMCIEDEYDIIDQPDCHVTAENVVTGMPDGENPGWFKKFDQPGICGLYSCRGQAQGSYECFPLNKLKKNERR